MFLSTTLKAHAYSSQSLKAVINERFAGSVDTPWLPRLPSLFLLILKHAWLLPKHKDTSRSTGNEIITHVIVLTNLPEFTDE